MKRREEMDPFLPGCKARPRVVQVRVSEFEQRVLIRMAAKAGMTVTQYLRHVVHLAYRNEKQEGAPRG